MANEGPESTEFVLVTERFHPDTTSTTGQLMTDLAAGLQERGLDMAVRTRRMRRSERESSGERLDGLSIKRVPVPEASGSSVFHRAFNWGTFVLFVSLSLLTDRPEKNREIIFVSHPPILPPSLWVVCKLRGWEYTYIVYDFYPDAAVELGYITDGGIVHTAWSRINLRLLPEAKHVVALGPVMRERLVYSCRGALRYEDVTIIHNWDEEEFIVPRSKSDNWFSMKHGLVDSFTLVYAGNIGEFHDLETVIRAAAEFNRNDVEILIIGEGDKKESIVDLADDLDVLGKTVTILPYQPYEDVPYTLTAGDATIVAVNEGFKGLCVSSKLYSSLAAGQPVLVISSDDDDEARIVEAFDAGTQVTPGDTDAVVSTIRRWQLMPELVDRQGTNAREAFEEHFTRDQSVDRYYKLLTGQTETVSVPHERQPTA